MENQPPQGNGPNMNYPSHPDEHIPQFGGQDHQQNVNMQVNSNVNFSSNQPGQTNVNFSSNQQVGTNVNYSGGPPQQGYPYAPQRKEEAKASNPMPNPQQNFQAPH
jgi:hypothetical protein